MRVAALLDEIIGFVEQRRISRFLAGTTWTWQGTRTFISEASLAMVLASLGRSTVSITSSSRAFATLFVCKGPIRCRRTPGNGLSGRAIFRGLPDLVSPKVRCPASRPARRGRSETLAHCDQGDVAPSRPNRRRFGRSPSDGFQGFGDIGDHGHAGL